jgi:hypothetical protein
MASDQSVTEFILFPPSVIKEDKDDRYGSKAIASGSYFNLFALEMEKRQAALVVTFLLPRCLELGERLKIVRFVHGGHASRVRSNDEKRDECGLRKCGPMLNQ